MTATPQVNDNGYPDSCRGCCCSRALQLPQAVGVPKVSQNISRDPAAKSCCRASESDLWSTAKTTGPSPSPSLRLLLRFALQMLAKTQQRLICCGADNLLMLIEPRTDQLSSARLPFHCGPIARLSFNYRAAAASRISFESRVGIAIWLSSWSAALFTIPLS